LLTGNWVGVQLVTAWTAIGSTALGQFGTCVSGAGDVNGDGFADVIGGEPYYDGPLYDGGRIAIYHGNGLRAPVSDKSWSRGYGMESASGRLLRRRGLVPDGSVRVLASGWSAGGRTGVAVEWDLAPASTSLPSPGFAPVHDWQDSGPVDPGGNSSTPLEALLSGLETGSLYHCRWRVATRSPYFPHSVWLTLDNAPEQLAHFRTGTGMVGVADGGATSSRPGQLRASPNPFGSGTRILFENPSAGPVRVRVFSADGRLTAAPGDTWQREGSVVLGWDGLDQRGIPARTGVYFIHVESAGAVFTSKVHKLAH
jgi:hypothetical protein